MKDCDICQRAKASYSQPTGLLQPLSIPTQVLEHITMEFIEGLPKSEGSSGSAHKVCSLYSSRTSIHGIEGGEQIH